MKTTRMVLAFLLGVSTTFCSENMQGSESINRRVVRGDVFIVPVEPFRERPEEVDDYDSLTRLWSEVLNQPLENELFIKIWIVSDESNNWLCHGHPILGNLIEIKSYFPSEYVPASLFKGTKEGDMVELNLNDATIFLTLRQKKYRYPYGEGFHDFLDSYYMRYQRVS